MEKEEENYNDLVPWKLRDLNVEMCTCCAVICFREITEKDTLI